MHIYWTCAGSTVKAHTATLRKPRLVKAAGKSGGVSYQNTQSGRSSQRMTTACKKGGARTRAPKQDSSSLTSLPPAVVEHLTRCYLIPFGLNMSSILISAPSTKFPKIPQNPPTVLKQGQIHGTSPQSVATGEKSEYQLVKRRPTTGRPRADWAGFTGRHKPDSTPSSWPDVDSSPRLTSEPVAHPVTPPKFLISAAHGLTSVFLLLKNTAASVMSL